MYFIKIHQSDIWRHFMKFHKFHSKTNQKRSLHSFLFRLSRSPLSLVRLESRMLWLVVTLFILVSLRKNRQQPTRQTPHAGPRTKTATPKGQRCFNALNFSCNGSCPSFYHHVFRGNIYTCVLESYTWICV